MSFFPWGQQGATSQPPVNYDLVINKTFPRIGMAPTEASGIYQEIIEVNGALWVVTNATWDSSLLGWYQEGTCNPALPAYAWSYLTDGNALRMSAPPAGAPNIALSWTPTFETDPLTTIVEPLPLTNANQTALEVAPTFNGTTGTRLNALQVVVDDIVSAANSTVFSAVVNGREVWNVDKTGTLQVGSVPSSQLNPPPYFTLTPGTGIDTISNPPSATIQLSHGDYCDLATQQTITAQKTFSAFTALQFGGDAYINGAKVGDEMFQSSGSLVQSSNPLTALALESKSVIVRLAHSNGTAMYWLYIDTGLTPNNTFNPTPVLTIAPNGNINIVNNVAIGGNTTVGGTLGVSGKSTLGDLEVSGALVLDVPALKDLANNILVGLNGVVISEETGFEPGGGGGPAVVIDGKNFAEQVTSNDGSVVITTTGPENQNYDLSVTKAGATGLTQAIGSDLSAAQVNATGGFTLSLPNSLPKGTWFVTCTCHGFGLPLSGPGWINMTGPTVANTDGIGWSQNTRTMYTFAQMNGGQTPQVTLAGNNVGLNGGANGSQGCSAIALTIVAIRIG